MVSGTRDNPPPSYPGRANFSLISLKNSTNCLQENANSSRGWASCLVSAGRVTLSGGTTFSHINTLARLWLKLFPEPAILSTCLAVSRETSVLKGTAVTTHNST